ncbi:MAG TPA: GNAT family N-acetyltransferase [Candidatus Obscuribacterales bacterium]
MSKIAVSSITGERVRLRPLEQRDLSDTLRWRNQERVRTFFKSSAEISPESHSAWFSQYLSKADDYVYVIDEIECSHLPVGQVSIYNINWDRGEAEFGRLLIGEPAALGKGYAREASLLLLAHWHSIYGIKRFCLEVKEENERAIRLYEQLGFTERGAHDGLIKMVLDPAKTRQSAGPISCLHGGYIEEPVSEA